MEQWKVVAKKLFPNCKTIIENSQDVWYFWIELWMEFVNAYKEPVNKDFIKNVYRFATWCLIKSKSELAENATLICFFEELPTIEVIKKDITNHLSKEDFLAIKEIFKYHFSKNDFEKFMNETLSQYEDQN